MKIIFQIFILTISLIQIDCQDYKEYVIKNRLAIKIPKCLIELDSFELNDRYKDNPLKPKAVFFDKENSITLQISYGINPLNSDSVEDLRISYETNFKEIYPNAIWLETKTKLIDSFTVGYLETIDKENYNLVFFTSLDTEQVHFVIQGPKADFKNVQKVARNIMESIKITN